MKITTNVLVLFFVFIAFISCKDDDDNAEAVTCEQWFEGNPCEAMITKFLGNYTGGAGFCGTMYDYRLTQTAGVVNGLDITIIFEFQGNTTEQTITALLTSSTEFDIPVQGSENASGFGSINGDNLTFFIESPDVGFDCTHEAVRVN